jgi:hypothetical protein
LLAATTPGENPVVLASMDARRLARTLLLRTTSTFQSSPIKNWRPNSMCNRLGTLTTGDAAVRETGRCSL